MLFAKVFLFLCLREKEMKQPVKNAKKTPKAPHLPRVSVLIPAYNVEKYIAESIESILNQTYSDFELIIINDGSTDNTAKIIQQYASQDKRIKFINHKKNRGVSAIRNELLDTAIGEYAAFHDSDDISLPTRLAVQVEFLDKHPDISVVSAALRKIPSNEVVCEPEQPGILDFYIANPVPNAVAMFRMLDINKYNLRYNGKYKSAEDYDFWQRVIRIMKIHTLPDVLYLYRILNNSLSHGNPEIDKYNNAIRTEVLDYLTHNPFWRIKLAPKYSVMLFGFIPILKVKRTRIYLFGFIPLLRMRNMWWYLFEYVPVCKLKCSSDKH